MLNHWHQAMTLTNYATETGLDTHAKHIHSEFNVTIVNNKQPDTDIILNDMILVGKIDNVSK